MGLKTGVIKYNLNDRGRTFIGQQRQFNIPAMVKIANSEKMKEKIKAGDLVGYLGHGVRIEYGLNPPEVILEGGKFVPIEPAFRTIFLQVHDDGTVEHEAEFIDTPLGKKAQEWFESKYGGFSSVVAPNERNPTDWYGFDYVGMPNFHTNRGYTLDSAEFKMDLSRLTSKQKAEYYESLVRETKAVMDAVLSGSMDGLTIINKLSKSNKDLQLTIDSISDELIKTRDKLNELELIAESNEEFSPMMRLSVNDSDNWVADSVNECTKQIKEGKMRGGRYRQAESINGVEFDGLSLLNNGLPIINK